MSSKIHKLKQMTTNELVSFLTFKEEEKNNEIKLESQSNKDTEIVEFIQIFENGIIFFFIQNSHFTCRVSIKPMPWTLWTYSLFIKRKEQHGAALWISKIENKLKWKLYY